jgi:hypothetical protein
MVDLASWCRCATPNFDLPVIPVTAGIFCDQGPTLTPLKRAKGPGEHLQRCVKACGAVDPDLPGRHRRHRLPLARVPRCSGRSTRPSSTATDLGRSESPSRNDRDAKLAHTDAHAYHRGRLLGRIRDPPSSPRPGRPGPGPIPYCCAYDPHLRPAPTVGESKCAVEPCPTASATPLTDDLRGEAEIPGVRCGRRGRPPPTAGQGVFARRRAAGGELNRLRAAGRFGEARACRLRQQA